MVDGHDLRAVAVRAAINPCGLHRTFSLNAGSKVDLSGTVLNIHSAQDSSGSHLFWTSLLMHLPLLTHPLSLTIEPMDASL